MSQDEGTERPEDMRGVNPGRREDEAGGGGRPQVR